MVKPSFLTAIPLFCLINKGEMIARFKTIKGKAKAIAADQDSGTIFVGGVHAQTNLFWPWLVAHDFEGGQRYQRWNWSKSDAWTGGTADSHLNSLTVIDGKFFVTGSG